MYGKTTAYLLCATLVCVGCAQDNASESSPEDSVIQGISLASTIAASSDVTGIRFEFQQVDCEDGTAIGDPIVVVKELEPYTVPGGISELEDEPLDADSEHLFADAFESLEAGCYDVTATPVQEDGTASEMCASATKEGVEVTAGQTTEVILINQCSSEDSGAIDAISVINHEPEIDDVYFEESKFTTCEEEIVICAEVTDPDGDPLEFVWELSEDAPSAEGPTVVSTVEDEETGAVTQCVSYIPKEAGQYDLTVTVFDLLHVDDALVRIEDWLASEGYPSESRATLDFFFYSVDSDACCACPDGYERTPAGDGCVATLYTDAVVNDTTYKIAEAENNQYYSDYGALYPDGTVSAKSDAPNDVWSNGRTKDDTNKLNAVGIWTTTQGSPTREWIGFSRCLQIEEAGDYLVGIAGDNRVRLTLNGDVVFERDSSSVDNFRYWHIRKVSLTSGPNVLVLEGSNDGGAAAFGAEISGPFEAGSLEDDLAMIEADYEGNIIFSTIDTVGGYFETGENSGISCPDGYVLDSCADESQCVKIDYVECNAGL